MIYRPKYCTILVPKINEQCTIILRTRDSSNAHTETLCTKQINNTISHINIFPQPITTLCITQPINYKSLVFNKLLSLKRFAFELVIKLANNSFLNCQHTKNKNRKYRILLLVMRKIRIRK